MTGKRVLTALVLIPVVVGILGFAPPWGVTAAVAIVILASLREFFWIAQQGGFRSFPKWTMFCSFLLCLLQYGASQHDFRPGSLPVHLLGIPIPTNAALVLFFLGAGILLLGRRRDVKTSLGDLGMAAAAMLFVAYPLSFLIRLHGLNFLLQVLVFVWVGDSAAYFIGRSLGRHALAPSISPNKTWEGAIANLAGTWLVASLLPMIGLVLGERQGIGVNIAFILGLATVISVSGQIGDLVESAYKRSVGVKDSGDLLPGHGGILDRIDALVFAAPAAWYYLRFLMRLSGND